MKGELYIVRNANLRSKAAEEVLSLPIDGNGWEVTIKPFRDNRTLAQNRRMWAMLGDIAKQVTHHGRKMDNKSWKCVFSAALKGQDVVPNLDGTGFVVIADGTSDMKIPEMADLITLMEAWGVEHNVRFTDPSVEYHERMMGRG